MKHFSSRDLKIVDEAIWGALRSLRNDDRRYVADLVNVDPDVGADPLAYDAFKAEVVRDLDYSVFAYSIEDVGLALDALPDSLA